MNKVNKKGKIIITILIILMVVVLLMLCIKVNDKFNSKTQKPSQDNSDVKEVEKEPEEKHYELSMIAVGDNLIHSSVYRQANRYANYNGYDFKPMIQYIKEIVSKYDIAYYNQETILGGTELGLSDYPTFNSPYEAGNDMIDAGFNLVSLATNHTMDRGKKAVENSCKYWSEKEDVLVSGSYCSDEERQKINIKEKNNITYTMLNYTYGTNGMPVSDDYLVNVWPTDIDHINNPDTDTKYQQYKEQVKADIDRVRDKVDVLIVAMHWGVEYTNVPTKYQEDMANFLASQDVDIIIGTHPHVIQPVTWINDTLVIYSLGNFISAQYQNQGSCYNYNCTTELMTNLKIEKTVKGDEKTIKITNVENELIYNYYNQNTWSGFMVIPFSNPLIKQYLPNYKTIYDKYKSIVQSMDSSMVVKESA